MLTAFVQPIMHGRAGYVNAVAFADQFGYPLQVAVLDAVYNFLFRHIVVVKVGSGSHVCARRRTDRKIS